jgi:transposase
VFHTTWTPVFRAVEMAVSRGRAHRDRRGITAIGIDELQWRWGHRYVALVYQLDPGHKRLLWLGEHRQVQTLRRFFRWLGPRRRRALRVVGSDMWQPYLRVVAQQAPHALTILDRFHIMRHLGRAIDQVRAQEARALKAQGTAPVLTHTRWVLLKRPEHLTEPQRGRLAERRATTCGRSGRTCCAKSSSSSGVRLGSLGGAIPDGAMRSRIAPMQRVAQMLRRHRPLLLELVPSQGRLLQRDGQIPSYNVAPGKQIHRRSGSGRGRSGGRKGRRRRPGPGWCCVGLATDGAP